MRFFITLFISLFLLLSCGTENSSSSTDTTTEKDEDVIEETDTIETIDEDTTDETVTDNKIDEDTDFTDEVDQIDDEDSDSTEENQSEIIEQQLVGTWAAKVNYEAVTNAPMIGDVGSSSQRYLKMEISKNPGSGISISQVICHIDSQAGTGAEDSALTKGTSFFANSFLTSFHYWRPADLTPNTPDAFVSITDGVTHFHENRSWELRGMKKMEDILSDLMPTDKSDPRIIDQDGDSHPGVTVAFEGMLNGDIYFVERLSRASEGVVLLDGTRIEGHLIWTDEQFTIDATSSTLAAQKVTTPDNENSRYIFVKIDETKTCEQIYAEKETLF